ncbi:MAG: hypothetical protein WAT39_08585 [Planctomycetota bacterium]
MSPNPSAPLFRTLLGLALCCNSGCTVVKPVVCAVAYPIDCIRERLAAPDSEADDDLPPVLLVAALPLIVPMRFGSDAAIGFVGGFFSGFASDLNIVTWNFASPARNLARPFKTNAAVRSGDG